MIITPHGVLGRYRETTLLADLQRPLVGRPSGRQSLALLAKASALEWPVIQVHLTRGSSYGHRQRRSLPPALLAERKPSLDLTSSGQDSRRRGRRNPFLLQSEIIYNFSYFDHHSFGGPGHAIVTITSELFY